MKVLRGQLSEAVGRHEEDDVKIKEFNVGIFVVAMNLSRMLVFYYLL